MFPFRDSGGIQTHNLLIRSQMLYSVELRNLVPFCGCKGTKIFGTDQMFSRLFSKKVSFYPFFDIYQTITRVLW